MKNTSNHSKEKRKMGCIVEKRREYYQKKEREDLDVK